MDVLFERGKATAAEVQAKLSGTPSYSAVRTFLRILETKQHVEHEVEGARYVYRPKIAKESAQRTALSHLVQTFFEGSAAKVVSLLVNQGAKLSGEELDEIANLVARARKDGKV